MAGPCSQSPGQVYRPGQRWAMLPQPDSQALATPCPASPGPATGRWGHPEYPSVAGGPGQSPRPRSGQGLQEHGAGDVGSQEQARSARRTRRTGSPALPAPRQARAGGTLSHRPAAPAGVGEERQHHPSGCGDPSAEAVSVSTSVPVRKGAAAPTLDPRCLVGRPIALPPWRQWSPPAHWTHTAEPCILWGCGGLAVRLCVLRSPLRCDPMPKGSLSTTLSPCTPLPHEGTRGELRASPHPIPPEPPRRQACARSPRRQQELARPAEPDVPMGLMWGFPRGSQAH